MNANETTLGIDAAVSAVIRAEAAAQKLTWPALAELSDVSKSTMSNYLNDVSAPKLESLERIAAALGLDLLEVLHRARERQAQPTVPTTPRVTASVPESPQTATTPHSAHEPRGSSRF
jgi:transcriptional regulator with XRE-family HTH domain